MNDPEEYISNRDTLSRLVRLETKICLKFEEMEKALVLARDQSQRDRELAKIELDNRLEGMNQFQKRMDKLEGTFATKEALARIERLVFIGVGIAITLQFIIQFMGKVG